MLIYTTRRVPSCCPHGFRSVEGLLWGAEPRFELGPALQQADDLLYEPANKRLANTTTKVVFSCFISRLQLPVHLP
jgi:hypothetical protein